ncbi:toll/interleukin-1 receptor domain-containing protein [Pseudoalteromonas sp. SWYJZ98]|uniref:toll/interleukin-1 receptor domain-containing protein n=1 Tax=Pseudoalteromonas sp. SWYJZ98 TaxID=2792060 RepID=UPI0018CE00DB|nr:toll/interleukin-1 receptor domain-containing protein [Pseudoalteromonas sp. SWYJZ98]MBH0030132.1 toll/interleukin-1 receptor domain-containing protein [Pseudoalteromonas sp. SWYJZ98]
MSVNVPKVFISYSHDTQAHKKWVLELAQRLRNSGVDAILDQFRVSLGDDLGGFMEKSVAESNRIIMVCTDNYVTKANSGLGGVGYEKMIMTAEYMTNIDSNKVIPLIRQNGTHNVPTFLKTRLHINFSREDEYELQFDNLLREIHQAPLFKEPPVGNSPFESVAEKPLESVMDKRMELLKEMVIFYNKGKSSLYFDNLHRLLGCSKIFAEIYISALLDDQFIQRVQHYSIGVSIDAYQITDRAKLYAIEQGWVTE